MHDHSNHSGEKNIKTTLALNICFTVIEFVGGFFTNSLAILSDALHDLGDSLVLGLALYAEKKSKKGADAKRTFGYARLSVLSATVSGAVLIGGSLYILSEAIPRLLHPESVNAGGMMILAVVGIIFNALGAWRLKKGESVNEKVLSWHLIEDVLGWITVLIGGALIYAFDLPILDPIITICFTLFILWGVIKSMREVVNLLLQGVPSNTNLDALRADIKNIDGVLGIHDLHVWSLDGKSNVLTAHVVVRPQGIDDAHVLQRQIKQKLHDGHEIEHSTIELETEKTCTGDDC